MWAAFGDMIRRVGAIWPSQVATGVVVLALTVGWPLIFLGAGANLASELPATVDEAPTPPDSVLAAPIPGLEDPCDGDCASGVSAPAQLAHAATNVTQPPADDRQLPGLNQLPTPTPTPTPAPARSGWPSFTFQAPWELGRRVTFLLLGIDARDAIEPARSDTMIIASIDPRTRSAAMLSIPRDLWVKIPTTPTATAFVEDRINVAYALGKPLKYPGGGAALAKRAVEHNFNVHIDYVAQVDFRGFERAIDALGGITVEAPKVLADTEYPTDDYGVMSVYFPPGAQRMDGRLALIYARSRHADSDFERARRQQSVILAARDEAMRLDTLARLPELINAARSALWTDVPALELAKIARAAQQIERQRIVSRSFDAAMCYGVSGVDGANLLMPRWPAINKAVDELFPGLRVTAQPTVRPNR